MSEHVLDQPDDQARKAAALRPGFHTTSDRSDEGALLRLSGELDLATAPALGDAVAEALELKPRTLAVDLSELVFIDSTGISVLIAAHRRAEREGSSLVLRQPRGGVLRTLQLTGVDQLIAIEVEPGRT